MKIYLTEERQGQPPSPERAYEGTAIRMGRDGSECQVVFDQKEWPMVSRKHAEFRLRDGKCVLADTNSRFGTFLDNQRMTEPLEVRAGQAAQLGAGGPVLRIVRIELAPSEQSAQSFNLETQRDEVRPSEAATATPEKKVAQPPQQQPKPSQQQPVVQQHVSQPPPAPRPQPQPARTAEPAFIEHVSGATGQLGRVQITKDLTTLGRDPSMDITIAAAAAVVSRRHAEIKRENGQFVLVDLGSFNGTLLNDQRITTPTPLFDGDRIQLGMGGPILKFVSPSHPAPAGASHAGQRAVSGAGVHAVAPMPPAVGSMPYSAQAAGLGTIVVKGTGPVHPQQQAQAGGGQPQLLMHRLFDGKQTLTIGRAPDNDIHLDGLQISNHHARVHSSGGAVVIEDTNSTNGVYINGQRITGRRQIQPQDIVQVGPFVVQANQHGVAIYDTRSKTRIDCIDITKVVTNRSGGGQIKLLDDVDLTIQPNEFVGLLGPSGAGKSTLMDSLNGMRPATSGHVLINNLDLYQHLDSLKQSIGYVPQDDIIHRELTVYRTLYYVARLRLSRDASTQEIDRIINEVMDVTGLSERRDVPVSQLSGGQRKRVSIAVELITKPSVIFLDEPTSGLDPATEEKIMRLFRQIAESGRTVILTTHAMENVKLFDKIVVMMRGKLVWYGPPMEALAHVQADSFKDLYDKLEAPINQRIAQIPPLPADATKEQKQEFKRMKEQISDQVAEEWKQRFTRTEQYRRYVVEPLTGVARNVQQAAPQRNRPSVTDSVRQWATLSRRYFEVLSRDKFNLLILFGQAPIIALLTYLVVGAKSPRDFPYFMLSLVAIWFGTSVAAREIIRERAVYTRERMVNLGLMPYVGSKLFVLSMIVGLQCILLFGALKFFDIAGLMKFPGWTIPQLIVVLITSMVGIALGLFVSAIVKTSEMATSLVPLILIPQILFSGLVGIPEGTSKVIGLVMPATWSFDELKRLSELPVLRGADEGAEPSTTPAKNQGRGLLKQLERENDELIAKARQDIKNYKKNADDAQQRFQNKMDDYINRGGTGPRPQMESLGDPPTIENPHKIPNDDKSEYIDFLHPWGNIIINPLVLLIMFFGLIGATILALRAQDIG